MSAIVFKTSQIMPKQKESAAVRVSFFMAHASSQSFRKVVFLRLLLSKHYTVKCNNHLQENSASSKKVSLEAE